MTAFTAQYIPWGFSFGLDTPTAGREGSVLTTLIRAERWRLKEPGINHSGAFNHLEDLARDQGVRVQDSDVFTLAQRWLLALPNDLLTLDLDVDNEGDVVFDWSGPDGRLMTVALGGDGKISFAARMSSTKNRNGNDQFLDSIPQEVIALLRAVTRP